MVLWHTEYIRRVLEENPPKSTRRLSAELYALKDNMHRQIKALGKSYRSCRSVLHELTPQQAQRRVHICCQLIDNPLEERFIRIIVTRDENGSITATLTP